MTQSVWIFVNIEHGQAFVTGKALSDGVGFIRFERRDFTLFNRGNESQLGSHTRQNVLMVSVMILLGPSLGLGSKAFSIVEFKQD